MEYQQIYERIDKFIIQTYPKEYKLNISFENDQNVLNKRSKIAIEIIDDRFVKGNVYCKSLREINLEIQNIGFTKYITKLKLFLNKVIRKTFSRGDLFWGSNDIANGSEQKGYRPYLIISNNMNNNYNSLLTVVPLTTKNKKGIPTHKTIMINDVKCTVLCEQITCVEKTDMLKFIRSISMEELKDVEEGIKIQLALNTKNVENLQINEEKTQKKGIFTKFFEKIKNLFKKEKKNEKRN